MEEKQEKSRIDRQFDFIREIDKEKFITRQTFLSDAKRRENDAEHAWHMAIMTLLLSEYANEEIDALKTILPTETAVVDARFKDVLKGISEAHKDSLSSIRLTSYEPNRLVYETENAGDGIAVFSEIYYPNGWQVTIDGKPAGLGRADYVLRALYIPAGKHTVEMRFDPKSLHVTEGIAYGALALLVIGVAAVALIARKKAQE